MSEKIIKFSDFLGESKDDKPQILVDLEKVKKTIQSIKKDEHISGALNLLDNFKRKWYEKSIYRKYRDEIEEVDDLMSAKNKEFFAVQESSHEIEKVYQKIKNDQSDVKLDTIGGFIDLGKIDTVSDVTIQNLKRTYPGCQILQKNGRYLLY